MVNAEISLSLGHPAGLALGNCTLIKHTTLSLSKKKGKTPNISINWHAISSQ